MKVNQLHALINEVTKEVLGESVVIKEDLSNIVSVGKKITDTENLDSYVKKLVNHIGKVVFVNRIYNGGAPSVLMDSWEYGSILEKVSADLPEAAENSTWDLTGGNDYSPNIFYKPTVNAKFFNSKVTFEIPMSFTEEQVKQSFSSAEQLNGFISMLTTSIENSMTVKIDALIMRTISNMIGDTITSDLGAVYTNTGVKAVNILKLYNDQKGLAVTVADALSDLDFIRYATYIISMYTDRMAKISKLFNIDGQSRFTPHDLQKVVLLSDFARASETFLASNTYNPDKIALPKHDSISYWQGSGLSYDFVDTSKINVKTSSGNSVELSGILGVIFDRDALGVSNLNRRVTTNYNPKAEFYTNFYKFDAGYYNDSSENFVVFFIG